MEQGELGGQRRLETSEMGGAGAAESDGELGGLDHARELPARQRPGDGERLRAGERPEVLLLTATKQLGEDPVGDDGGEGDAGLFAKARDQLEGLVDRHLLGGRDDDHPRLLGVGEHLQHPGGPGTHRAERHEVVDRHRRRQVADNVAGGGGVDDDEVVVLLAHLVAELARRQQLAHPGRRGGDEVERLGDRGEAGEQRDVEIKLEVLRERRLGVHRHREQAGRYLARRVAERGAVDGPCEVAPRLHLADERALAGTRGEHTERARHRRLADAALARHEHQAAVEEAAHHLLAPGPAPLRRPDADTAAVVGADLDVGDATDGDPDAPSALVGHPQHPVAVGEGALDARVHRVLALAVRKLDVELPRCLDDADPQVHVRSLFRSPTS